MLCDGQERSVLCSHQIVWPLFPEVVHCLQNLLFLFLTLVSLWLQAKEPMRPVAIGVARGPEWDLWLAGDPWPAERPGSVSGTHGCQWDLQLSAYFGCLDLWPMVWLPL